MSKDCCIIAFVEDDNCSTTFLQTVDIKLILCHIHVRILGCFELFCFVCVCSSDLLSALLEQFCFCFSIAQSSSGLFIYSFCLVVHYYSQIHFPSSLLVHAPSLSLSLYTCNLLANQLQSFVPAFILLVLVHLSCFHSSLVPLFRSRHAPPCSWLLCSCVLRPAGYKQVQILFYFFTNLSPSTRRLSLSAFGFTITSTNHDNKASDITDF